MATDELDGKQARRTKASSQLGELFDHGFDSLATFLLPLSLYSVVGRANLPLVSFFHITLNILLSVFVSHWEKYMTGVFVQPAIDSPIAVRVRAASCSPSVTHTALELVYYVTRSCHLVL